MDRMRVRSSVIASLGYAPEDEALHVEFHTGRLYTYFGIPQDVYDSLLASPSLGSYFNQNIRDHYPFTEHGARKRKTKPPTLSETLRKKRRKR